MKSLRLFACVALAALLVEGLGACTGGPELNPQPLPPEGEGTTAPPRAPDDEHDPASNEDTSGGAFGDAGARSDGGADGGAEGGEGG